MIRVAALAALAGLWAGPAAAQAVFGETAVQSPTGRPIVFHYAPADSAVAAALADLAAGFAPAPLAGLSLPPDTFHVWIAPSEAAFREMTGGRSPDWGLAVAFPALRRIVLRSPRLTGSTNVDPAVVLRHELNHLYLAAAAGPGADEIPRWFNEGFAALYADEWRWVAPYRLAWARITRSLPPLTELDEGFPAVAAPELAYVQSMAAVRSLHERGGAEGMRALLLRLRNGATFDAALRETFGLTLDQFYADWESELGREYGWTVAVADERNLWVILAVIVVVMFVWRRRSIRSQIRVRKRREDAALGDPDDHSLGVEEQERYWESEDDAWRGEDED
ncbi:MAG TPA: hypothetical protein VM778_14670 [Gemmatimonadota bacterium]|nr:hypothetical protein [Gemmatimonadota bacterium]